MVGCEEILSVLCSEMAWDEYSDVLRQGTQLNSQVCSLLNINSSCLCIISALMLTRVKEAESDATKFIYHTGMLTSSFCALLVTTERGRVNI
jgi:hypothetical protein